MISMQELKLINDYFNDYNKRIKALKIGLNWETSLANYEYTNIIGPLETTLLIFHFFLI